MPPSPPPKGDRRPESWAPLARSGVLRSSHGQDEAAQPVFEARPAEPRLVARRKRAIVQLRAEVSRVDVGDHLTRVLARAEEFSNERREAHLFWTSYFNRDVRSRSYRHLIPSLYTYI